jgi:hypothetical protein
VWYGFDMSAHKYLLRVPEDIWEGVRLAAVLNGRSVNREIVWRLRQPIPQAVAREVSEELRVRNSRRPSFRPDFRGEGTGRYPRSEP